VPGTRRCRIHGHEFRDTFKTTCKVAGVDGAVAEFFIGHRIDPLGYDKSPWAYPEHFKEQYLLVEPYLSGEQERYRVQLHHPAGHIKACGLDPERELAALVRDIASLSQLRC